VKTGPKHETKTTSDCGDQVGRGGSTVVGIRAGGPDRHFCRPYRTGPIVVHVNGRWVSKARFRGRIAGDRPQARHSLGHGRAQAAARGDHGAAGLDLRKYRFAPIRNASGQSLRAPLIDRGCRERYSFISPSRYGCVSEVATDEVTPELVRGVHDDEAARRRVYDKITRPSNGTDELSDETDRLDMGVKFAVDFFRPSVRNAAIVPSAFRRTRRLLQNRQVTTTPPRPVTISHAQVVPNDEVNTLEYIGVVCDKPRKP
jgi:hypothetical protein